MCFQENTARANFTTLAEKPFGLRSTLSVGQEEGYKVVKEIEGISLWKRYKICSCSGQGLIGPWNQLPTDGSISVIERTSLLRSRYWLKEWLICLKLCRGKVTAVRMHRTIYMYKIYFVVVLILFVVWAINSGCKSCNVFPKLAIAVLNIDHIQWYLGLTSVFYGVFFSFKIGWQHGNLLINCFNTL